MGEIFWSRCQWWYVSYIILLRFYFAFIIRRYWLQRKQITYARDYGYFCFSFLNGWFIENWHWWGTYRGSCGRHSHWYLLWRRNFTCFYFKKQFGITLTYGISMRARVCVSERFDSSQAACLYLTSRGFNLCNSHTHMRFLHTAAKRARVSRTFHSAFVSYFATTTAAWPHQKQ